MYAVIEIQGSQYKAEKGAVLTVDRMSESEGDKVVFDKVLMLRDDKKVKIGEPFVKGATVKGVVEEHTRGPKVIVRKYKRRKRYKRTRGHRQQYSQVRIEEISASA
jgi:large subunit ribosomal protein L21